MTSLGWVFLALSWGCILAVSSYCFYRVLRGTQKQREEKSS